jgi:uncharacterized NAD(P)/FAD-binding protein YdhS
MGAFPDDIGHFYRWLEHHPSNLVCAEVMDLRPDAFIPRLVFGDYIHDLLRQACEISKGLDVLHDEIVDMTREDDGSFQLLSRQGTKLRGRQVVLALGNFPPGENDGTDKNSDRPWFSNNPYAAETHAKLAEPGDILIIGTGLTSLDVLLTLAPIKQEGQITLSHDDVFSLSHIAKSHHTPCFSMLTIYRKPPASFCVEFVVKFESQLPGEPTGDLSWTLFARFTKRSDEI